MTTVNILRGFTTYENGKRVRYEKGGKPDVDEAVAADWSAKGLARRAPKPAKESDG